MTVVAFDEQRVRRAARVLGEVAVELRAVAAAAVDHAARTGWTGGARRRHDEQVELVAEELDAIASRLEEVVDEAWTATVRARHLVAFRRAAAHRAATARLSPPLPRTLGADGGRSADPAGAGSGTGWSSGRAE